MLEPLRQQGRVKQQIVALIPCCLTPLTLALAVPRDKVAAGVSVESWPSALSLQRCPGHRGALHYRHDLVLLPGTKKRMSVTGWQLGAFNRREAYQL